MSDSTMPVTEAVNETLAPELQSYELAYHVLPTVAEGEVDSVTAALKELITKAGGSITSEESPERFELAYEVEKYLEGKYRRFNSAYFGWVRFTLTSQALPGVTAEVAEHKNILRHLMIRLTKAEEQNPFRFHEALVDTKVRNIDLDVVEGEVAEGEVVDVDADVVVAEDEKPVV
jgi:ribosomal protein S6